MKKTIVTVFSIIIVLVVMGVIVNIATSGSFFKSILTAVAEPINGAWASITGNDSAQLIRVEELTNVVQDENDLSVFD